MKLLFILLLLLVGCGRDFDSNNPNDVKEMLVDVSQTINKQMPMVINKYQTVITTIVSYDTLKYYYSYDIMADLKDIGIDDCDDDCLDSVIKEYKEDVRKAQLYNICESPELKTTRKLNAYFKFIYKDITNKYLFGVTVSNKDCK